MFGMKRWSDIRPATEEWMEDINDIPDMKPGNQLNGIFKEIFSGGKCTWSSITHALQARLDDMVWNGILSYKTACRILNFVSIENEKNIRIISEDSDIIALARTEDYLMEGKKMEQFNLLDLMQWFTYEINHDTLFSRRFYDKTYSGIIDDLNKTDYFCNLDECLFYYQDFVPNDEVGSFLFYLKNNDLYIKYPWQSEEGAIICNNVKDARIYWGGNWTDYLAVNCINTDFREEIVIFEIATGNGKGVFPGIVYGVSENLAIIKSEGSFYMLDMETLQKKELHKKHLPPGYLMVTDAGIVCRSFHGDICKEVCCFNGEKTRYYKLFDIQVGWQILIDRCFNLTGLNLSDSIKNRLVIFDVYCPPLPMTRKKVKEHLEKIIRHIAGGINITLRKDFVLLTEVMNKLEAATTPEEDIWEELKESGLIVSPTEAELEEHILWIPPYMELFDKINLREKEEDAFADDRSLTEESGLFGGLGKGMDIEKLMADIDKKIAELEEQEKKEKKKKEGRGEKDAEIE